MVFRACVRYINYSKALVDEWWISGLRALKSHDFMP